MTWERQVILGLLPSVCISPCLHGRAYSPHPASEWIKAPSCVEDIYPALPDTMPGYMHLHMTSCYVPRTYDSSFKSLELSMVEKVKYRCGRSRKISDSSKIILCDSIDEENAKISHSFSCG